MQGHFNSFVFLLTGWSTATECIPIYGARANDALEDKAVQIVDLSFLQL